MDESSRRSAAAIQRRQQGDQANVVGGELRHRRADAARRHFAEAIHRRIWLRACAVSASSMPGTQQTRSALAAGAKLQSAMLRVCATPGSSRTASVAWKAGFRSKLSSTFS